MLPAVVSEITVTRRPAAGEQIDPRLAGWCFPGAVWARRVISLGSGVEGIEFSNIDPSTDEDDPPDYRDYWLTLEAAADIAAAVARICPEGHAPQRPRVAEIRHSTLDRAGLNRVAIIMQRSPLILGRWVVCSRDNPTMAVSATGAGRTIVATTEAVWVGMHGRPSSTFAAWCLAYLEGAGADLAEVRLTLADGRELAATEWLALPSE